MSVEVCANLGTQSMRVCVCVCVTENKYFKFDMYTYIRYVYVRFSADITFY